MISKHGEKGNESTLQVKKRITPTSRWEYLQVKITFFVGNINSFVIQRERRNTKKAINLSSINKT